MSEAPSPETAKLLHIRPDSARALSEGEVDGLLAGTSRCVETRTDVYRGLATLCRSGSGPWEAVIVCADGLGAEELEFFSIASRMRPRPRVYVYGDQRSRSRMARAIELGATGRLTGDVIRALTPSPGPTLARPAAPCESSSTTAESPADPPVAAGPEQPAPCELVDADVSTHPARVPWLRYADAPARQGPEPREAVHPDAHPEENVAGPESPVEPLLTDAELEALLGDDIAAIAPENGDVESFDERKDEMAPS